MSLRRSGNIEHQLRLSNAKRQIEEDREHRLRRDFQLEEEERIIKLEKAKQRLEQSAASIDDLLEESNELWRG